MKEKEPKKVEQDVKSSDAFKINRRGFLTSIAATFVNPKIPVSFLETNTERIKGGLQLSSESLEIIVNLFADKYEKIIGFLKNSNILNELEKEPEKYVSDDIRKLALVCKLFSKLPDDLDLEKFLSGDDEFKFLEMLKSFVNPYLDKRYTFNFEGKGILNHKGLEDVLNSVYTEKAKDFEVVRSGLYGYIKKIFQDNPGLNVLQIKEKIADLLNKLFDNIDDVHALRSLILDGFSSYPEVLDDLHYISKVVGREQKFLEFKERLIEESKSIVKEENRKSLESLEKTLKSDYVVYGNGLLEGEANVIYIAGEDNLIDELYMKIFLFASDNKLKVHLETIDTDSTDSNNKKVLKIELNDIKAIDMFEKISGKKILK